MLYINALSFYLPAGRVDNAFFQDVAGLSEDWLVQRTGIKTRSKAEEGEDTNSMAVRVVEELIEKMNFPIGEIDLIVGASYSPADTVFTIGHSVQRHFNISDAQVVYVSSACSSLVNALEIVQGYFAMGKAKKALVVGSEHNWAYNTPNNADYGHLWGDGAVATVLTKDDLIGEGSPVIIDIFTRGLGHIGQADTAVNLFVKDEGIRMANGRDVFQNACTYMELAMLELVERNNLSIHDIKYFSTHQANKRIMDYVAERMGVDKEKFLVNIDSVGNTGSPSHLIALAQHVQLLKKGDYAMAAVFGGGYSCGSYLIKW